MNTEQPVMQSHHDSLGIIVLGHGTRDEQGYQEFLVFVDTLSQWLTVSLPTDSWCVTYAFLELAKPDFMQSIRELHARGIRKILVVPVFLVLAGHMKRDVPLLIERAFHTFPGLAMQVLPAFGDEDAIIQGLLKRLHDMTANVDVSRCAIVLVYRGSSDVSAIEQVQKVAEKLADALLTKQVMMASMFGVGESVDNVVARVRHADVDRIIILPFLLFHGFLFTKLRNLVKDRESEIGVVPCALSSYLGVQETLVELTAQRILNFIWKVKS